MPDRRSRRTVLVAVSPPRLRMESGGESGDAFRVRAFRDGDFSRPARRVAIRYTVVSGPLELVGGDDPSSRVVRTDRRGEASVGVRLPRRGCSLVAAELANNPDQRQPIEATVAPCHANRNKAVLAVERRRKPLKPMLESVAVTTTKLIAVLDLDGGDMIHIQEPEFE